MSNKYYYSVLSFWADLRDPKSKIPIAVLVEGKYDNNDILVVVGREPQSEFQLSEIGKSMTKHVKDIIGEELKNAMEQQKQGRPILETIAQNNRWNLSITEPKLQEAKETIFEFALSLYAHHIISEDRMLRNEIRAARRESSPIVVERPLINLFRLSLTPEFAT